MDETTIILIIETLAITLIGSLLHFTYEWSGKNKFVAIFSAVNESTWEHIKLALSATFVCLLVDLWWLGGNPNYWVARSISFLVPIVVIPIIFYGYTSFTKRPILPIDIGSFVVAAFLSTLTFVAILNTQPVGAIGGAISIAVSVIVIAMYLLLTRFPLHGNALFQDPITGQYGYEAYAPRKQRRQTRRQRKQTRRAQKRTRRKAKKTK